MSAVEPIPDYSPEAFEKATFDAITACRLPLSLVENPHFIDLIRYLRPDAAIPTATRMREMARKARNTSGKAETG
jgi:hypothetical protein